MRDRRILGEPLYTTRHGERVYSAILACGHSTNVVVESSRPRRRKCHACGQFRAVVELRGISL